MRGQVGPVVFLFLLGLLSGNTSGLVMYRAPIVNKFGQAGLFHSHSARTLGMGRLSIGGYANTSASRDYLHSVKDGSGIALPGYNPALLVTNVNAFLGYGITHFIDLSAMLPAYLSMVSRYESPGDEFGGVKAGVGDLEVSLKFQYPPFPKRKLFKMAYFGAFSFPTGSDIDAFFPRHAYYLLKDNKGDSAGVVGFYTSDGIEVDMKMLWTFDFGVLNKGSDVTAHMNWGVRWTPYKLDHLFLLNIALEYAPADWITLFTEFSGEARVANIERGFKLGEDPLRLSPGISVTPPGGLFLNLGMDISLASDTVFEYVTDGKRLAVGIEPRWRLAGTVGWAGFVMAQDADHDGIKDNKDRCPQDPEDIDGFEDKDGCPDLDNDADGIPDLKDKCPNDAEDVDGFEDKDGCPDNDNDKDLVADVDDQCPNVPEDLDGFEDKDGCPEWDNDKDGIPDSVDHCMNIPEDVDGFQDKDGCPDYDNDLDEVPDSVDSCPDVPGEIDNKGCPGEEKPKAMEIKRGRVILRGVNFESGKAVLTEDSYVVLDRVAASLAEWPEIRVEIRGHTDSVGSRAFNRRLSGRRADSVRSYLMSRGIPPDRLTARGIGEDEPIAENTTAQGRFSNRRVELHRID